MAWLAVRTCPIIVGRDDELATGARLLAEATGGHGQFALIAGEAGIGKSRLARALRDTASRQGFTCLTGVCGEHDRAYPFAPLLDAVRQHLRYTGSAGLTRLFASDTPFVARLLPDLASPAAALAAPVLPESEQRRLFEAFARMLSRLAAVAPVCLALEDLHWADESTMALLTLLPRRLADARVLMLLTARSDEPGHSLAHWRNALTRAHRLAAIDLAPLTAAEMETMIAATVGDASPTMVAAIAERAEGNPLFVEELLHAWVDGEIPDALADTPSVPTSVREMVTHRLDALASSVRAVAEAASVIGRQFDFATLRAVTGQPDVALIAALRALVAASLVTEGADDTFAFRHALTHAAVYARLLAVERRRRHEQVAGALAAARANGAAVAAGVLGYHYHAARAWEPAMRWCGQAGEEALALAATAAAATHATRALDAANALGAVAPALLYLRGEAYRMLGKRAGAEADLVHAVDAARDGGDDATLVRALVSLGVMWAGADLTRARGYYEEALTLARARGEAAIVARTLTRLAYTHILDDRPASAWPYVREARARAEAAGDVTEIAQTHTIAAAIHYGTGDLVAAVAEAEAAIPGFEGGGNGVDRTFAAKTAALESALGVWGVMAHDTYAPSIAHAERAWRIGRESGYLVTEAETLLNLGLAFLAVGEYGATADYIARAGAMMREIDFPQIALKAECLSAFYLRDLFAFPQALRHAARAYEQSRTSHALQMLRNNAGNYIDVLIAAGEYARAAALLDDLLPDDGPLDTIVLRELGLGRADLLLATGDPARALTAIDRVLAHTPHAAARGPGAVPRFALTRGRVLLALGQPADAIATLAPALAIATTRGEQPTVWRLAAALGAAYDAMGDTAAARAAFTEAQEVVATCAAGVPEDRLRAGFTRGALALVPPAYRRATRTARNRADGLTRREREVVTLVAQGRSNPEIAANLFITRKTVESHITRILRKLGLHARADLVAWVQSRGLRTLSDSIGQPVPHA